MSGLFAYAGSTPCREILAEGLCKMAHRGRELAGMAVLGETGIELLKMKGNAFDLKEKCAAMKSEGSAGLAECADAVRCRAANITAVPSANNFYCAALDGTIDNFDALRRTCSTPFPIATQEDLLLALLCSFGDMDRLNMLSELYHRLDGAPSLAFIPADEAALFCLAGETRLAVGIGDTFIAAASEMTALPDGTKRCFWLEEGEYAKITASRYSVYDARQRKIKKSWQPLRLTKQAENDCLPEEEIFLLPLAVKETVNHYVCDAALIKETLPISRRALEKAKRAVFIGSGTDYYIAGMTAQRFELLCDMPCTAVPSGELRYANTCFDKNTLLVAVSHRGEEGETLSALQYARRFGVRTVAVTANSASQLAALADDTVDTYCELGENSLRAVLSAFLTLSFLALYGSLRREIASELYVSVSLKMAEMLTGKVAAAIRPSPQLHALADRLVNTERLLVTGIGADSFTAMAAAQHLRRVCRAPAWAMSCHELLCESADSLAEAEVLALMTDPETLYRTLRCLRRLRAQGASVTVITTDSIEEEIQDFEQIITFPESIPLLNPAPALACIGKAAVLAKQQLDAETENQAV